jgi:hypothetical protein
VARGEDQPQPLVGDRAHGRGLLVVAAERPQFGFERHPSAGPSALGTDPVDGAVARGGDDPRRGVVGDAAFRPPLERGDEGVLDRLLGTIEIAKDAGEDGDRLSRLAPEQTVDEDVLRPGQACIAS